jgi:hypothetical protein
MSNLNEVYLVWRRTSLAIAAIVGLAISTPSQAQNAYWTPWRSIGNGVLVSFSFVNGTNTWTWKFVNNNNSVTVTDMKFQITSKGSPPATDILPLSLKPGQSIGGWTTYTYTAGANDCPYIQILEIKTK